MNNNYRLLLVGNYSGNGGVQTHIKWLLKILEKEKIKTLFVSTYYCSHASEYDSNFIEIFNLRKNNKNPNNGFVSNLTNLLRFTRKIREFAPDIYLTVGTGWNTVIPIFVTPIKRKIFHEVTSGYVHRWNDSRKIVKLFFDEVISHTSITAKNFTDSLNWNKEIEVLSAIPEPLEQVASLPQITTTKAVNLGSAKAAFFGRLESHKQPFWLVQQWNTLKEFLSELHLYGTGSEQKQIEEYIKTQKIGDRVKCFGRYPDGQGYVDLLSQYDLTLLPTIQGEGAPLVLLESMACGVPFVTHNIGGIADYGKNNPNVLIVSPQENNFVKAVQRMTEMLSKQQIKQSQLQEFYLQNYSYQVLKQAWLSYLCNQNQ